MCVVFVACVKAVCFAESRGLVVSSTSFQKGWQAIKVAAANASRVCVGVGDFEQIISPLIVRVQAVLKGLRASKKGWEKEAK